jgi:hypothetical protein
MGSRIDQLNQASASIAQVRVTALVYRLPLTQCVCVCAVCCAQHH